MSSSLINNNPHSKWAKIDSFVTVADEICVPQSKSGLSRDFSILNHNLFSVKIYLVRIPLLVDLYSGFIISYTSKNLLD